MNVIHKKTPLVWDMQNVRSNRNSIKHTALDNFGQLPNYVEIKDISRGWMDFSHAGKLCGEMCEVYR